MRAVVVDGLSILRGDFCAVKRLAAERGAGGGQERVRT